jgi:hypothetical protein
MRGPAGTPGPRRWQGRESRPRTTPFRLLAVPLLALLLLACSREPRTLADYFPDGRHEQRVFEVLEFGAQRGFYVLRTTSVAPDEGRGMALFFLDPRHRDLVGEYHLVIHEERLSLRLSDHACTLEVFRWPPVPGDSWQAGPGTLARVEGLGPVKTPAGTFRQAAHLSYEIGPELLQRLGFLPLPEPLRIELWLAPFEGPVRLKAGAGHEERLVERR